MAFSISIKADDNSPIMAVLSRFADLDKNAMFDEIGQELVISTQFRFANQHDVEGNPWKQSWRAKLQNGQTLRDTGRLMNSLTHNVMANGVEVGTDFAYAHVLQLGAHILPKTAKYLVFNVAGHWRKVSEVKIPPRPFLGINDDDERMILDVIEGHLLG